MDTNCSGFFGETVFGERLTWHASSRCDHCGYALEEDDNGPLPDTLREMQLLEQGIWSLAVEPTNDQKLLTLKTLRETLGLSLSDVAKLETLVPGLVLSGTRAEMEYLAVILTRQGISAAVVPSEDHP